MLQGSKRRVVRAMEAAAARGRVTKQMVMGRVTKQVVMGRVTKQVAKKAGEEERGGRRRRVDKKAGVTL